MLESIVRTTFRFVPVPLGFAVARTLAARPPRVPIANHEAEALASAERLRQLGWSGDAVWSWGSGPTIILIHGWGGRASQMAPLAAHLAVCGFRAICFDIAGHGESRERQARWDYFIRDISDMVGKIGNTSGLVGHSAGGLAMMAARSIAAISAPKYVCICAPSHPFPPILRIQQRLNPHPTVLERYKRFLEDQFQTPWEQLEAGSAFQGAGQDLLLCYDLKDRFINHSEGDRIRAICPEASLLKTASYGHARILGAPEIMESVGRFLGTADGMKINSSLPHSG